MATSKVLGDAFESATGNGAEVLSVARVLPVEALSRQEAVAVLLRHGHEDHHPLLVMVGVYDGDRLRYAGNVGTGCTEQKLKELSATLAGLRRDTSPFADTPRLPGRMTFVEPELVADVEYTEWTSDGRLRHPSFRGLRDDKDPRTVVRELPA